MIVENVTARARTIAPPPTHFEVLLPSGRTGWVPVAAVRPLETDHLCYARTPAGEWRIAAIDQAPFRRWHTICFAPAT
jgi:hypothetical protein